MTRRRLLVPALVAGLAVLVLTGCGNDTEPPPHHGLRTEAVTSKPEGDPIE